LQRARRARVVTTSDASLPKAAQRPQPNSALAAPVGVSAQELPYHAFVSFGDRPRAPDTIYGKAAGTCRPMKACPWGWNRLKG